ncbi:MAG TPA: hypothetical protein VF692_03345 [Pyrinomonadaceae bacterium]|jgi:hypothetical protein
MTNKNYQIAKFYSKLFELKNFLNGELLPIGVHIKAETLDPKLFESLEVLATDIEEHLNTYELSVNKSKT